MSLYTSLRKQTILDMIKLILLLTIVFPGLCRNKKNINKYGTYLGVLSQRNLFYNQNENNQNFEYSEIETDLVRWVEQTGAEVVLVPYDMPFRHQKELLSQIDG